MRQSADLPDLRVLFTRGVHRSDALVLLATKDVLTRPWCLLELWEAQRAAVPIIVFVIVGRGFNAPDARSFIERLEHELPARSPDALAMIENYLMREHATLPAFKADLLRALELAIIDDSNATPSAAILTPTGWLEWHPFG